jgi:uncharacterized protein HemX
LENVEKKSRAKILLSINIVLTVLLLIIALGLTYYGFTLKQRVDQQIKTLDFATTQNSQKLSRIDDQLDTLQNSFQKILPQQVEIYQVGELIALANQMLVVYGDTNDSLRLLNYAKQQLNGNSNPAFDNLKAALGYDITQLENVNTVNKVALSGEIDSLNALIANLHLNLDTATKNSVKNIKVDDSIVHKFLANIKNTLYSLITISKTTGGDILVPSKENIAKENMHFDLFSAKVALLGHDEKSWLYNLHDVDYYLNTYFKEYAKTDKIQAKIAELTQINVANDNINIDNTIKAINKLKALN